MGAIGSDPSPLIDFGHGFEPDSISANDSVPQVDSPAPDSTYAAPADTTLPPPPAVVDTSTLVMAARIEERASTGSMASMLDSFLTRLGTLQARAMEAECGSVELGAAEAQQMIAEIYGPSFPKEAVTGATMSRGGAFEVRFSSEVRWEHPSGSHLRFGANNDEHVVRGQLYRTDDERGVRVGGDNGFEATAAALDIDRMWLDAENQAWVKPSGLIPASKL